MNRLRQRTLRIISITGLSMLVVLACTPGEEPTTESEDEERLAVEVEETEESTIEDTIYLTGEIEPTTSVEVISDQAGEVTELFVDIGDRVRRDEVIARIDPSRPGQRFATASVRAPVAGTITSLAVRTGSNVSQGTPLGQLASTDDLEINTYVPERRIGTLSLGQEANVELDAFPGERYSASVSRIAPGLDQASRALGATLRFNDADSRIRPGMFARIDLIVDQREGAITVPQRAIVRRAEGDFVYVVDDDGRAERRTVTLGFETEGRVEVTDGVSAGEEVVTRGQNLVQDGALLEIVDFDAGLAE
ncbi:MAG: efflux RND transporter periplasmic adaptor subunit [Spirochaetales bacterium]